jgi:hypothetical protein
MFLGFRKVSFIFSICLSFASSIAIASGSTSSDELPTGTLKGKIRTSFNGYNEIKFNNIKNSDPDPQAKEVPEEALNALEKSRMSEFSTPETIQPLLQTLGIDFDLGSIDVQQLSGGFVSGIIYKVAGTIQGTNESKAYFIKYLRTSAFIDKSRTHSEPANLGYIKELIDNGDLRIGNLALNLPLATYSYVSCSGKGRDKLFTISESAEGIPLTKIVKDGNYETIERAFQDIGKMLGELHNENMSCPEGMGLPVTKHEFNAVSVPAHGDFHADNLFYSAENNLVSTIDNETLRNSFAEGWIAPLFYDLGYLIQSSGRRFEESDQTVMKESGFSPFKSLLNGYIETFDLEQQQGITHYLLSCLKHIKEIKYQDIFRKVGNTPFTWKKGIDNPFATKIVKSLQEHLQVRLSESESDSSSNEGTKQSRRKNNFLDRSNRLSTMNHKVTSETLEEEYSIAEENMDDDSSSKRRTNFYEKSNKNRGVRGATKIGDPVGSPKFNIQMYDQMN